MAAASPNWSLEEALPYCDQVCLEHHLQLQLQPPRLHGMQTAHGCVHALQLDDLYEAIHDDLKPWASTGIDRATMARSVETYTTRGLNKGIALAFMNGTAYVVEANIDKSMGHHANIAFTYMQAGVACTQCCLCPSGFAIRQCMLQGWCACCALCPFCSTWLQHRHNVMQSVCHASSLPPISFPTCPHCSFLHSQVILELQQLFGRLIPDVEFVIASSDRPMVTLNSTPPYAPVLRFCSSAVHADIQIPIFHL